MDKPTSDIKTKLNKSGVIAFVPGGDSMWPTLKNKKQSVIVNSKSGRLNVGDVAFYTRADGSYILHRVKEVVDGGYVMLGDSQINPEKVAEDSVFGVMAGFYRGKKYIDVNSKKYKDQVTKWYSNENRRLKKIKRFYLISAVIRKIKGLFCKKEDKK